MKNNEYGFPGTTYYQNIISHVGFFLHDCYRYVHRAGGPIPFLNNLCINQSGECETGFNELAFSIDMNKKLIYISELFFASNYKDIMTEEEFDIKYYDASNLELYRNNVMDYAVITENNWVLGFAISVTHDDFQWSYTRGNAYMNSGYVGLYSRLNHDNFYMNLAILGAYNSYDTLRDINFSTIHRRAVSDHDGSQFLTHASLGYWLTQSYFDWSPYVNVDYVYQHENGFTESGAQSLNLQVNSKNSGLVQSEFGITFQKSYKGFTPMVTLAYVNQTQCLNKNYYARFVDVEQDDISDLFAGRGYYNRNLFTPRLGCLFNDICDKITVSLFYDAQVGTFYWAQDLVFDLTICF